MPPKSTPTHPRFVPPSIAVEAYGVTAPTLRRWANAGQIEHIKTPGGQYRYRLPGHDLVPEPVTGPEPRETAETQAQEPEAVATPAPPDSDPLNGTGTDARVGNLPTQEEPEPPASQDVEPETHEHGLLTESELRAKLEAIQAKVSP